MNASLFPELEYHLAALIIFRDNETREAFAGDKWTRGPLPEVVVKTIFNWGKEKRFASKAAS